MSFFHHRRQNRFRNNERSIQVNINNTAEIGSFHLVHRNATDNTGIVLNLAINYGGQAEILHAVQNIVSDVQGGVLRVEDIDSQKFEDYLYTRGLPAPDLLIRPGGDLRISNFMLWQIAYAEIWTTEVYWPAFTPEMFWRQ